MAQPPLSQQIRNLESELGVALFTRRKKKVELTHAGRVFLGEARKILARAEQAAEKARRADRGEIGPLVIGCGPMAVSSVLPRALPEYRAQFPEVDLILHESLSAGILESLKSGKVDVGLLLPPFDSELLEKEAVVNVPLMAALPRQHRLARRRRIRLNQLGNEKLIVVSRLHGHGYYECVVSFCTKAGFTPSVIQEATQIPTLLVMVAAGYGVALVPEMVKVCAPENVVLVSLEEPVPKIPLYMAWRSDNVSPVLPPFLTTVRECCQEKNGTGSKLQ